MLTPITSHSSIHTFVQSAVTNLQPSSFSQVIALKLLQTWGYERFAVHTQRVAEFYREKRDLFEEAMRRHLTGLAEWSTPVSGMFVWYVPVCRMYHSPAASDGDVRPLVHPNHPYLGTLLT